MFHPTISLQSCSSYVLFFFPFPLPLVAGSSDLPRLSVFKSRYVLRTGFWLCICVRLRVRCNCAWHSHTSRLDPASQSSTKVINAYIILFFAITNKKLKKKKKKRKLDPIFKNENHMANCCDWLISFCTSFFLFLSFFHCFIHHPFHPFSLFSSPTPLLIKWDLCILFLLFLFLFCAFILQHIF